MSDGLGRTATVTRGFRLGAACGAVALLVAACGTQPGTSSKATSEPNVLASVINVTPFEINVVLSGVLADAVDTVRRTVGPSDSTDVAFVCPDELVVGDPLEPTEPGVVIEPAGQAAEVGAFTILAGESFACGDVVEIIVSGTEADTLAVDVFALTPP